MSAALATISVTRTWMEGPIFHALGTVTIGASPLTYTTGGIAMALNDPLVKASRVPLECDVIGKAGYIYRYVPGTDVTDGLLMVFAQTASASEDDPLGQLASASAIPAACSGDTVTFHARFLGQN